MKLLPRLALAAAMLAAPIAAIAGPISKWDDRKPDHDYASRVSLYDFERCILNTDGWPMPMVYRQPDRPDEALIMYFDSTGNAGGRIDLRQADGVLRIKAWKGPKAITSCAPPLPAS